MPDNVPGAIHNAQCPEHALTPTPPPPSPPPSPPPPPAPPPPWPPPSLIVTRDLGADASGDVVQECREYVDAWHSYFPNPEVVLTAFLYMEDPFNPSRYGLLHFGLDDCSKPEETLGGYGHFWSPFYEVNLGTPRPPAQGDGVTATFTSVLNQNGIYQLHVNGCPAYYQRFTSGVDQERVSITSRFALPDGTRVLVRCREPNPSPPPPPPPPDAYETGKCAFFSRSYFDFSARTEFEDDTGLSTASYNGPQPTIVVSPSVDNPTFLSAAKATTGDARRNAVNGHPALYYNVASSTITDEAQAHLSSSMTNARCIELCQAWRADDALQGCRSYEYTMHDGAKSHEHGSTGPTEGENKLMRCKMWVYPRNPGHYTYVAPMDGATICEAASGLPIVDRENSAVVVTQPWPPNLELEFQEMYSGFVERSPDHELLNGLGMADLYGHDVALSFDGRVLAMRASEYVWYTSYADTSQYEGEVQDDQGYVRVVEWNGADWVQRGQTFHGPHRRADLGYSIALDEDGDTLAFVVPREYTAGNFYDDSPDEEARGGTVRVYDYDAALQQWVQRGQQLTTESLFGNGTAASLGFAAVNLNNEGDRLLLGVPRFNPDEEHADWNKGVVIMFRYDAAEGQNGLWVERGQRILGEPHPGSWWDSTNFGHSTSMSQDATRIVIADGAWDAPGMINVGMVRVYDYDANSSRWIQNGADIVGASADARIGDEVSMAYSGNSIAISSRVLGRVFVYDYDATSTDKWVERGAGQLAAPAGTNYGRSVALSADGTRVVVGQTGWVNPQAEYNSGWEHGRARIYSWSGGTNTWIEFDHVSLHGTAFNVQYGWACAISRDGKVVAVSMPEWNDPNGPGPGWQHNGKVFVFEAVPVRTTPAPPPSVLPPPSPPPPPVPPPPSPLPTRVYALVGPDTRCDAPVISGFTSHEWTAAQNYLSCCSNTDDWSGAVLNQNHAQLKANCEAACSSGVRGECNMITYDEQGASCNLGYYDDPVRIDLVDSVSNGDCLSFTGMSVWVLAPADAYTLAGAGAKCTNIYSGQNWANGNSFNPCCREHDGDSLDFSASATHKNFQLTNGKEVKTAGVIQVASCDAADTYTDESARTFTCEQAYNQPADHIVSQHDSDHSIYHSASTCDDSAANQNWVAFYFVAPADIAVVEVINRGDSEENDGCCGYRLGNHEIYYCTNSATTEEDCDWKLCATYDDDTTNRQVIDHECDASAATGFKLAQTCTDKLFPNDSWLHVIEVKAYGYPSFEQLRANCEAACDGWGAPDDPGSCNVITYQDKNRCNLGHHSHDSAEDFIQQVDGGSCNADSRYDTYVRNAP